MLPVASAGMVYLGGQIQVDTPHLEYRDEGLKRLSQQTKNNPL